jgi:spore maturation protein CgeB
MKLAPVMNLVPDVGRFFEQGTHYEGFTNLNEAVERVVWLKEHPVQLKELAERAYQNVQGQHYDARVDTVLKECGF